MQSLTKWEDEHSVENPVLDKANGNIAQYLRSRGRYREAEMLYARGLANREKLLGPEHPDTLWTVNKLAMICYDQGRYEEAEALFGRALASNEKLLGSEHPDTLWTVNILAENYRMQGRYKEAETLLERALAGRSDLSIQTLY
jgi:tetratricopeptide (TPR) repeat protein